MRQNLCDIFQQLFNLNLPLDSQIAPAGVPVPKKHIPQWLQMRGLDLLHHGEVSSGIPQAPSALLIGNPDVGVPVGVDEEMIYFPRTYLHLHMVGRMVRIIFFSVSRDFIMFPPALLRRKGELQVCVSMIWWISDNCFFFFTDDV